MPIAVKPVRLAGCSMLLLISYICSPATDAKSPNPKHAQISANQAAAIELTRKAETHARFFDPQVAIDLTTKALAKDPHCWFAYQVRGRAYSTMNKSGAALADFAAALNSEEWGRREDVLRDRAGYLCSLHRYDEACRDLDTIAAKDGSLTDGMYGLRAMCLMKLKKPEAAAADLSAALKFKPGNERLLWLRGEAYQAANKYKEAINDFTMVIEGEKRRGGIVGVSPEILMSRAKMYDALGKSELAAQDRKTVREIEGFNRGKPSN